MTWGLLFPGQGTERPALRHWLGQTDTQSAARRQQIETPIDQDTADGAYEGAYDGAYDSEPTYQTMAACDAVIVVVIRPGREGGAERRIRD